MKKRKIIITATLLLLAAVLWFFSNRKAPTTTENQEAINTIDHSSDEKPKAIIELDGIKASPKETDLMIDITGRTVAKDKIILTPEVPGILQKGKRHFQTGNYFAKGETIFTIARTDFDLKLKAARAQYKSSLLRLLADVKADHTDNFTLFDSYVNEIIEDKPLKPIPAFSKRLNNFLSVNGIFQQYYSIKSTEENIDKYQFKAPYSGMLISTNVSTGSVVAPGTPLGQFMSTYSYDIITSIPLVHLDKVKVGMSLPMTNPQQKKAYTTKVSKIIDVIDPKTQMVKVYFSASHKDLKEGMYLTSTLNSKSHKKMVTIPSQALTRNNQVYVVKDSIVSSQTVEVVDYKNKEVLVDGIAEGQIIITEKISTPIEGTKVSIKLLNL